MRGARRRSVDKCPVCGAPLAVPPPRVAKSGIVDVGSRSRARAGVFEMRWRALWPLLVPCGLLIAGGGIGYFFTLDQAVARERLQILLAHERGARGQPDLLAILREEILAVIEKHFPVERDNVQIKMDRGDKVSMLEIDVEIPNSAGLLLSA